MADISIVNRANTPPYKHIKDDEFIALVKNKTPKDVLFDETVREITITYLDGTKLIIETRSDCDHPSFEITIDKI